MGIRIKLGTVFICSVQRVLYIVRFIIVMELVGCFIRNVIVLLIFVIFISYYFIFDIRYFTHIVLFWIFVIILRPNLISKCETDLEYQIWLKDQRQRKLKIHKTCEKYGSAISYNISRSNMMYDQKHKLLFCRNAKVFKCLVNHI